MIGPQQAFLNVGVDEPVLDCRAAQNIIYPTPKVAGPCVLPSFPAGIHTRPSGMELSADVPENGLIASHISLPMNAASKHEVVEETPGWKRQEVVERHAFFPQAFCQTGRVHLGADDVEVATEKDLLSHGNQVADPDIDCVLVCLAELCPCLVTGGWAVQSYEDESRELQDHASTFGVESRFVNSVR